MDLHAAVHGARGPDLAAAERNSISQTARLMGLCGFAGRANRRIFPVSGFPSAQKCRWETRWRQYEASSLLGSLPGSPRLD